VPSQQATGHESRAPDHASSPMEVNLPHVVLEIERALEAYSIALETNDLEHLDDAFWNSENAVRFGAKETLVGIARIREFRKGRGARTPLHIDEVVITAFGEATGTVCMVFTRQGAPNLIGRWSQHWAKIAGRWKITSAHVSEIPLESARQTGGPDTSRVSDKTPGKRVV